MGNLNDYVNLAKCYLRGEGVQKDLDKAVTLAEYAGVNGCSDGYFFIYNISLSYFIVFKKNFRVTVCSIWAIYLFSIKIYKKIIYLLG